MIAQIKGKLIEKYPTHVIIDCNGLGYMVNISLHTYGQLGDDEAIKLFTHLQIKEDSHTLFGFFQPIERTVFRLLISISGIGASIARTMLSSMSPIEIQHAILTENLAAIKAVKGIGLKTAQRVLIELKDKVQKIEGNDEIPILQSNRTKEEALSALEVLGYPRRQSEKVIDNILQSTPDSSIEEVIKIALNKL
ncbi:MAG: Holliday junction branch migration protein RuvA [Flavobacteriales bacterium]|jgi:holliday junction DNA helicase RuvA|nr:Holliday junction branch migration protein RuvA [Candidatus Arcticimaribacter sp.]MDO7541799.1 Holliday junction branch migration protein RuvA [Flavobacteriaceae bacterium]MDA9638690.1 Holliday junction branch migration protein RuvA [Candidatus Arcticimaribacter sp.]MDO7582026.1 Holliday junction branch migration protein RuvA [Flavobacteriaceae bacterium]MDO7590896.1 Holliday junction branch migration protein RuvA [Flavobacteriaceae bacterium]MDO7599405.1 Holliday junction branch migration |tara:strand:+ start:2437 stop:3018 length:582 start_codon:yes stop_codon:yes gene_type:complete